MGKIKYCHFYYTLLVLYILNQVLSESQFVNLSIMAKLLFAARYAILGALFVLLVFQNIQIKRWLVVLLAILLLFVCLNLFFADGGLSYIPIVLFVIGAKNCSSEKIFRYTIWTLVISHIFIILCAKIGILEDTIDFRFIGEYTGNLFGGAYYRHNAGFLVHNQIALAYFILYLYIIVYKRENLKLFENIFYMLLNYAVFHFFGSRIVFLLTFFACALFYVIKLLKHWWAWPHPRHAYWFWIYPVLTAVSLGTALAYNPSSRLWLALDMIFNNRIRLANEAIRFYGISIIGAGKNAGLYNSATLANNTVDNGYIATLISGGIVVTVILIGIWTFLTYLAEKKHNKYLVLVLVMIAIENLVNTHIGSFKLLPFFCILINPEEPFLQEDFAGKLLLNKKNKKLKIVVR